MRQVKHSFILSTVILVLTLGICSNLQSVHAQNYPNTITFENYSGGHALVKLIGQTGQTVNAPERSHQFPTKKEKPQVKKSGSAQWDTLRGEKILADTDFFPKGFAEEMAKKIAIPREASITPDNIHLILSVSGPSMEDIIRKYGKPDKVKVVKEGASSGELVFKAFTFYYYGAIGFAVLKGQTKVGSVVLGWGHIPFDS